ncbi:MAG: hypothetical protein COA69_07030 [Robiginitomaculum sp.]|nr:MAG: hypothetical protein COA69_07030 [Robiginitomaculum sp.]
MDFRKSVFLGAALTALSVLLPACSGSENASSNMQMVEAKQIGQFTNMADVGDVSISGNTVFDATQNTYTLTASGANIWGTQDAFQYVWKEMSGDVFASADIKWVGEGKDLHRKAGIMIRESLAPDARYADVMIHGDGLVALQYREERGGETRQIFALQQNASRVRLEKEGDYVFLSVADEDGIWRAAGGNMRIPFKDGFLVGLGVSAHDNTLTETAIFSDVSVQNVEMETVTETGYPAGVDSSLEILEVGNGARTVVHTSTDKFEAPNWSRDGSYLLFNGGGKIWKLPLNEGNPMSAGAPVAVNTGRHLKNNNDHGISPDGTQLIISDQSEADDFSRIYVLPIEGSDTPRLVMGHPDGRSYWHAWTPDGKTIAYTAQRPDISQAYNIWAKDLAGGEEWRVTDSDVLDDGADFSPDGQWLYFNSTRTGAMQIWRTTMDGAKIEQITFDENFRDWFAHPSPDGKWLMMVSFALDVDLTDHPPNRNVWLRIMPADLSEPPRVVAKLFGGQGTINVPSWSPDSTRVAFVSYRLDRPDRP